MLAVLCIVFSRIDRILLLAPFVCRLGSSRAICVSKVGNSGVM